MSVDVVIAVHSAERPVARAVRSVLEGNERDVTLWLVCHDIAEAEIRPLLDRGHAERVRFLEHRDGLGSASGPFNAGIDAGEAEFVSILGSDDRLMPGAIQSWLALAGRDGAEAIITRLERGRDRVIVPTPPTRPWRRRRLDGVRDRLCYRSAPLGLVSRATITRLGLHLAEGAVVGGDVGFVTRLWFGAHVAFDRTGPAYVIGEDATDRVTYAARPIKSELKFLRRVLREPWFSSLRLDQRRSACVKYLRIHLFGAVHNRLDVDFWTSTERRQLAKVARALLTAAPQVESALSIADRRLLDVILDPEAPVERLLTLAVERRRHGRPATLLTRDLTRLLARDAPVRTMAASWLVR